jgi:hypothetical protein
MDWWQILVKFIVSDAVLPAVGTVLVALLVVLARKWKIKVEKETLESVLSQAIAFADQKIKKKLQEGKESKNANAEKLEMATDFAKKLLKQYGLIKQFGEWVEDLIESKLGQENSAKG